jgi:hypothetical protein
LPRSLASDGYLMLGAAETTTSHSSNFSAVPELHRGVYVLLHACRSATVRMLEEAERRKGIIPRAIAWSASWQELIAKPRAS